MFFQKLIYTNYQLLDMRGNDLIQIRINNKSDSLLLLMGQQVKNILVYFYLQVSTELLIFTTKLHPVLTFTCCV